LVLCAGVADAANTPESVLFSLYSSGIQPAAMAVDAAGNIYVVGSTQTNVFPATAGAVQPFYSGGTCFYHGPPISAGLPYSCPDAFVIKLDPAGSIVYATYLGGNGDDQATAVAVDPQGNAYVVGLSTANGNSPNSFPVTPGAAFQQQVSGAFVAKISPDGGQLIYSMILPGADVPTIAADASGSAYVATTVLNPSLIPTTAGAFQTTSTSPGEVGQILKLSADGRSLLYSTLLGGTAPAGGADSPGSIAVDGQGNAFVAGTANSPDFPVTQGALQATGPGAYVVKLNPAGSALVYGTLLGPSDADALQMKIDAQGDAYVLGFTGSASFPVTPGAWQTSPTEPWAIGGATTPFLAKLSPDGSSLIYGTYLAGGGAIDVDPAGNAFVVGSGGAGFPVTTGARQRCMNGGGSDLFEAELSPGGSLIAATYLGGSGGEQPYSIAVLPSGLAAVLGTTNSLDFPGIELRQPAQSLLFVSDFGIDTGTSDGPCVALALQNGASFVEGPVAPGELITLRGSGFGPVNGVAGKIGANGTLPTTLSGVQVFFGDTAAPLLYVQSGQINVVVPFTTITNLLAPAAGPPILRVEYQGVPTNSVTVPLTNAAPGIFILDYATGQPAVLNQDGTLNTISNPAKAGSIISIFGTGGDFVFSGGPDGALWPASPLSHFSSLPLVSLNGESVEVVYGGSAPGEVVGVFQVNARVPTNPPYSGTLFLQIQFQNEASQSVPITVE
jgi:uncharacterized protein (TIGR03437 family)